MTLFEDFGVPEWACLFGIAACVLLSGALEAI